MLQTTRGIVLRPVKYGDTSLIVSVFTESFGIQSYIINGVRTEKRGGTRAGLFQPGSILELVVYHHDQRNIQRIKEFRWAYLYREMYANIIKTTLVLYMMELLQKCLKQPEANEVLYQFLESTLISLDTASDLAAANTALHFTLALASHLGFRIGGQYSQVTPYLDLQEGFYTPEVPEHHYYLEGYLAEATYRLLEAETIEALGAIRLNQELRRSLLQAFQLFYSLHVPDFGTLRSLGVLQDILG
jgi:DNA repair protein RecO (recombination protein O)